ncbi:MAG TPA: amidohydrolase family protein [Anaerolineae bacterium]|jgi:5-methylthioadenosine/S-adenosylhomocysteine deaminase|nr:amidohydrolase family protein [Anaerolineae bacterium]
MLLAAKWVLPISHRPIEDGAVVVEGSRIKDVGKFKTMSNKYPDEEVVSFGKAVILPGFVDLHTHLEYSVFRGACDDLGYAGWKIQLTKKSNILKKGDWALSAYLGALEALQSGITTIADITNSGTSLRAAKDAGLRGVIYYEVTGMAHTRVPEIMAEAENNVAKWIDMASGTNLTIGFAPHSPYTVSPPLYKASTTWAREHNLKICTHLAGSKAEYDFIKYGSGRLSTEYWDTVGWGDILWQPTGVSPVKYLEEWGVFDGGDLLAVHCVQVDEADIDILKRYNVAVAHCPRCNAKLGMGIAPLPGFLSRQLRIGIGTDSPASNNTMDVFDEMRIGLLIQRGITKSSDFNAEKFVYMATLGGAEAVGLHHDIGSLDPGKQADIVAVDMSHSHQIPTRDPYSALVYTANQENVVLTMVSGKVLYENGTYTTLDEAEILKRAEPIRRKLKMEKPSIS